MAEKEGTERLTFTLNEKVYYSDSVTEEGNALIRNIGIIDQKIQDYQMTCDIAKIAKDSLILNL